MRIIILSDLHLGATAGAATSDALISFLEWITDQSRHDRVSWRLVVLGDLLDLLHAPAAARSPLDALDAVGKGQRPVLAAMGKAAADGLQIDIVPGNHDSELADPEMQDHLRTLVADAAGTSTSALRENFRVRPWFLLVPELLYAEHGSQYHALNAVADPLAPFGRWSRQVPPGAVLDLVLGGADRGTRMQALPHLLPASLRALTRRGRTKASTATSLEAYATTAGLSRGALGALRGLAEDSPTALWRSASAAVLRRAGLVESQQKRAAVSAHRILAGEGQPVPVYVFGHTHRAAHAALDASGARLLWFNSGAWVDGGYGFVQVSRRPDDVVARLCRWDPVMRSAITLGGPLPSPNAVGQERVPTTRGRSVGKGSAGVARP